jgi:hypothetical protein
LESNTYIHPIDDYAMTLITGSWKFFTDKKQADLHIDSLTSKGKFTVSINNWLTGGGVGIPSIQGEGLWDDVSQQITMFVSHEIESGGVAFIFNGYQIEGPEPADPAGDRLWILMGTYQVLPIKLGLDVIGDRIPAETPRRQTLGWYAQITEVK